MNEDSNLIKEQFERLPEQLKRALDAVPWKSLVKEIALLNKLSLEQIPIVERETMFILYGFQSPDDYVGNLMREAKIDEATAVAIAQEVDKRVLQAISQQVDTVPKETGGGSPLPEIVLDNLPMVEPGQTAHDVEPLKIEEKPAQASEVKVRVPVPDYRYPNDQDPYREPLV